MSSVEENARMIRGCTETMVSAKVRFRERGSCCRWFWLARIMSGRSQHVNTSRGDDVWSVPVHWVRFLYGWYEGVSHCRLSVATSKLYMVVLVHRNLGGERRVVGRSIIVGRMIFSIVGG